MHFFNPNLLILIYTHLQTQCGFDFHVLPEQTSKVLMKIPVFLDSFMPPIPTSLGLIPTIFQSQYHDFNSQSHFHSQMALIPPFLTFHYHALNSVYFQFFYDGFPQIQHHWCDSHILQIPASLVWFPHSSSASSASCCPSKWNKLNKMASIPT